MSPSSIAYVALTALISIMTKLVESQQERKENERRFSIIRAFLARWYYHGELKNPPIIIRHLKILINYYGVDVVVGVFTDILPKELMPSLNALLYHIYKQETGDQIDLNLLTQLEMNNVR